VDAEKLLEDLQGRRVAGGDERIRSLRSGLQRVIAEPDQAADTAQEALDVDDVTVADAVELPREVEAARKAVHAARARRETAAKALELAQGAAARAGLLAAAESELREAEAELGKVDTAELTAAAVKRETDAAELRQRVSVLTGEREGHAELAAKEPRLAGAEGRLAELEPALQAKRAELAALEQQLAALPPLGAPPALSDATERAHVAACERTEREAQAAATRALDALGRAREASGRLAELERDRAAVEAELADWTRLAADLGRDGLQALEIDAAGPELTELTNDLLHSCHGPRWTVRVETQRLSADGKRTLEGCDIMVLDTVGGREAEGETFSGGERVMIGEALSLALSMLACRRAGIERPTLVRDESGAALDPENARVYVAMLRRAAKHVGAEHVLFVSHSPEVQEMADSRIEVGA
jgi:exonuclease SbcC